MTYVCDCGQSYSSPTGVEACQINGHGKGPPAPRPGEREEQLANALRELVIQVSIGAKEELDAEALKESPAYQWARRLIFRDEPPPEARDPDADGWEEVIDALDHIARVCRGSRTQTRRIRWIEARARCALEGGRDWRELQLPKVDPTIEGLEDTIRTLYLIALESADGLQEELDLDTENEIDPEEAEAMREELHAMRQFVKKARNYVPRIRELEGRRA